MLRLLAPVLVFAALLGGGNRLRAGEEPARRIVRRALEACGLKTFDRPMALRCRLRATEGRAGEGKGTSPVLAADILGQSTSPSVRLEVAATHGNRMERMVLVLHRGNAWVSEDGQRGPMGGDELTIIREAQHFQWVTWLLPVLQDRKFGLFTQAECKVRGRTLVGVKVSYPGRKDVVLYFDRASGLLDRAELRWSDKDLITQVFHDYRPVDHRPADEKLLRRGGVATDGPGLLAYLRRQLATPAQRAQIKCLIGRLGSTSYRTRRRASRGLREIGRPARDGLRQASYAPDQEVARQARKLIKEQDRERAAGLDLAAVRLIAWKKPAGAAEVLLAYLPHAEEGAERREVQAALGEVAFRDAKPDSYLLKALDGPDPAVRRAAAAALGRDGGAYARLPGRRLYLAGIRVAHHMEFFHGKRKLAEMNLLAVDFFNRHDDRLFARPAEKPGPAAVPAANPAAPPPPPAAPVPAKK